MTNYKQHQNYFIGLVDGETQFDLSQQLTESQLKRFDSRGRTMVHSLWCKVLFLFGDIFGSDEIGQIDSTVFWSINFK